MPNVGVTTYWKCLGLARHEPWDAHSNGPVPRFGEDPAVPLGQYLMLYQVEKPLGGTKLGPL